MENQNLTSAPYGIAALVLGIGSLVTGFFFIGLILGIVGLILANNGLKKVRMSPEIYSGIGMLKAGRITSIIGIVFGAINTLIGFIILLVTGGSILWFFELLEELAL